MHKNRWISTLHVLREFPANGNIIVCNDPFIHTYTLEEHLNHQHLSSVFLIIRLGRAKSYRKNFPI